jgi:hypothetical protein
MDLRKSLVVLAAGVVIVLAVASLATPAKTANAAVTDVQGVLITMGCDGESVFGTDFDFTVTADGELTVGFSTDPDVLVMPNGTEPGNVERIEGTTSFREPDPDDPALSDVVYEVSEVGSGQYVVTSLIACDYEEMHDRTGYRP